MNIAEGQYSDDAAEGQRSDDKPSNDRQRRSRVVPHKSRQE